jgi:mRNA-degrading endonuclease RelE of RelBE toxin-antitoxin system
VTVGFTVLITAVAEGMLRDIARRRGRAAVEQLRAVILDLRHDPEQQTQPLTGALHGLRSLHSGRFRVVVKVVRRTVRVYVVGVGWHASGDRVDVYQVVRRLIERGRIDADSLN